MIPYQFGEKHKAYMRRALSCTMNVAEGAVRSGKTVDNVFVFAHLLETTTDISEDLTSLPMTGLKTIFSSTRFTEEMQDVRTSAAGNDMSVFKRIN